MKLEKLKQYLEHSKHWIVVHTSNSDVSAFIFYNQLTYGLSKRNLQSRTLQATVQETKQIVS